MRKVVIVAALKVLLIPIAAPASADCKTHRCKARIAHRQAHRIKARAIRIHRAWLDSTSWCESHNDPRAIGGGGRYRGMFQMTFSAWRAAGGRGDPIAWGRFEQRFRAVRFADRIGWNNVHTTMGWPVCG